MSPPSTAEQALAALRQGNDEFVQAVANQKPLVSEISKPKMSDAQSPFAAVLGCADSRTPAELIFNQAFGDLFVVRVAGNVASATQIASLEFACVKFGTPLILVMGHTHCGAVQATLEHLVSGEPAASPALGELVDAIKPALADLDIAAHSREQNLRNAGQANIRATVSGISQKSNILHDLSERGVVKVVGAEYDIATGVVDFFE